MIISYNKELIYDSFSMLGSSSDFLNFLWDNSHAFLNTFLISYSDFSNCPDTFLNKLGINLVHILFELFQDKFIIFIVNDSRQYFDFFVLDIVWISEFREEALDIILKDRWTFLDNILDVLEDHILDLFWCEGNHRDNWRGQLLNQVLYQFLTRKIVQISNDQFNAAKDHCGVDVGQSWNNFINDPIIIKDKYISA